MRIFYQTDTEDYESSGCVPDTEEENRQFLHDLLDEWIDSFRNKKKVNHFHVQPCTVHTDDEHSVASLQASPEG